ncbi:hypothetical protein C8R47DRAFT_1193573 [Mycena vitilis]|nr:hypothetical protein C8R47DRAFT_1193573 [Mycena vitilis]
MPQSIFSEILLKLRRIYGAGFNSLLRLIWLVIKHLIRLRGPTTPGSAGCAHLSSSPGHAGTFYSTAPHLVDESELSQPVLEARHSSQPSASSTSTKAPQEIDLGLYEYPQRPASTSSSHNEDGSSTYDMHGIDRLQPIDIPPNLRPIRPDELLRYEPKAAVATAPATFTVKPLQVEFCPESLPPGWEAFTQFEGQVFFYHKEKNIITEAWLYDPECSQEITSYIQTIDGICEKNELQIPPNSQLVLERRCDAESTGTYCGYYFAHSHTRCVFWIEDYSLDRCLTEVKGGQLAPEHVRIQLELQYWKHFEYFETIQVTSRTVLRELREMLVNSFMDTMTCPTSTVNYDEQQLANLIKLVDGATKDLNGGGRGCPLAVGKIMSLLCDTKFLNFHGQEAARLSRNQSVYGVPPREERRSWAMSVLSPILFYVPDTHLHGFDKIWVDEIASTGPWKALTGKLISEWSECTAFATILLNANVAFLDIPGVENEGSSSQTPLAQLLSSISLVLSIGTAILGLVLVRHHRTKRVGTVDEAVDFFNKHHLERTAIIYSLPYALLMYGMACFLAAFLATCFSWTSITTRLTIGIFCALTSLLVLWCLTWQVSEDSTLASWLGDIKIAIRSAAWGSGGDDLSEDLEMKEDELQRDTSALYNRADIV